MRTHFKKQAYLSLAQSSCYSTVLVLTGILSIPEHFLINTREQGNYKIKHVSSLSGLRTKEFREFTSAI